MLYKLVLCFQVLCNTGKSIVFFYLQKEIRSSLVLSMLQQMLMEDKTDLVREAVIKSLGIIMGYIDDPDKYQQVSYPIAVNACWLFYYIIIL